MEEDERAMGAGRGWGVTEDEGNILRIVIQACVRTAVRYFFEVFLGRLMGHISCRFSGGRSL